MKTRKSILKPQKQTGNSENVPEIPSHLTGNDVCLLADLTPGRVSQLTKAGVLRRDSTGEFPFIPTAKALIEYYKTMNDGSVNNRYWTARAELAEMKVQDMRKRLLRRDHVRYAMKRIAEIVTEEIQKAPEELAPKLDPEKPDTMAKIIRTYCEKILHDMRMNTEAEFGKDFVD